jgi:3alpha(or 20beta)-hydroxysteroid dehydrogenase
MNRLDGRIVIVTGGARGMGAAHTRALIAEGAKVVIADVLDDAGQALAAELGDVAAFVHLDVTDPDSWSAAVEAATAAFGTPDVLVNNAGIADMVPLEQTTLESWNRILAVNLTGVFLGMQAVVPGMKQLGRGSIVNISSVEGLRGSAFLHAYVASKFAVRGITKSVAVEVARSGIRVNSIHPGFIRTPMTETLDETKQQIPLRRGAEPEEVSHLVVYLASDESGYSTGAEFVVDGGMTAAIPHN